MLAIKKARRLIQQDPNSMAMQTLAKLVLALESEADFRLADMYKLEFNHFQLAVEILEEWRLDSYYAGKMRLFDTALQATETTP